jgi:2-polyprenyl-6-methoxyphenol hydroxylase-like FAD-dependent oxidoreductase
MSLRIVGIESDPKPVNPQVSSPPASGRKQPVVVVGAGPTGLLLAAELVRRDIECLLLDGHDAPLGWDRATVVHARSIEILEALGLADRILSQGVRVRGARLRADGRTLGELDLGLAGGRYGFDLGLSEQVTESVLTEYLEDHGGAVTRAARLVGIRARPDGVVAMVEREGDRREVEASWIVGCDGFHSTTRRLAGIDFPGSDLKAPWAVFDATIEGWEGEYDLIFPHFDIPSVILTPLPGRRWRVYLRPTSDRSDLVSEATITIHRYAPSVEFAAIENPNTFACHSRVAATFRSGRVFLAGDAAHSCSPSEGHGMNTGLQDAFNLGWKLALAWRGAGGTALLDSYDAERRPVALRIVATGEAFEGNQSMTQQHERAQRDEKIRRTFTDPLSAHHEAVAAAELDRSYADSGLVVGNLCDHLAPGDLLPNTIPVVSVTGDPCALHQLTHRLGHTVLVLGGKAVSCDEIFELVNGIQALSRDSPVIDAVLGFCVGTPRSGLGGMEDSVADQLDIEGMTVLAVRPDRFIGFRYNGMDPQALGRYLDGFTH